MVKLIQAAISKNISGYSFCLKDVYLACLYLVKTTKKTQKKIRLIKEFEYTSDDPPSEISSIWFPIDESFGNTQSFMH